MVKFSFKMKRPSVGGMAKAMNFASKLKAKK
jgi:hypothetical protein